jgi:macrolide transport system ATP-binding/permease protein
MDALRTDLRFAVRALLSRPGFSALAVLTLAIGIGVNAVAFSAINGFLYKTRRFAEPRTLGWISVGGSGNPYGHVSWLDYREIADGSRAFEAIVAEGRRPLSLRDERGARQIWALCVSSNYLPTLRARPVAGRIFDASDASGADVPVVVSYRFWKDHLGGEGIAGKTLMLNARAAPIVGVLPDDFQGPGGFFDPDVWVPLEKIDVLGMSDRLASRTPAWLGMSGRLASGITPAQATADLQALATRRRSEHAETWKNLTLTFWPVLGQHPDVRGIAPIAYILLAIVGVVLLLACFNVAGLLLARAADRQREISVRAALGAARSRILRQFALEGLLLALLSGAAAIVVAQWSAELLSAFSLPAPIPQRLHLGIDRRVVGFTAALVALAGILPALLPAYQATRVDLLRSLRVGSSLGQARSRTRSLFVVGQIAGSTLLLTVALLFLRSFWENSGADPGFATAHVLVVEIKPSDYGYTPVRSRAFFDALMERVRGLPGVEHAAVADRVPFYVGFPKTSKISTSGLDCAATECRNSQVFGVGVDHFKALGVPVRAGREFTMQDIRAGDGAIVSQAMAARLWPGRNAVGEWIRDGVGGPQRRVIGVAADVKYNSLTEAPTDRFYRPLGSDDYGNSVTLIVRTASPSASFAGRVQEQLQALDADLPPGTAKTMEQRMELPLWPVRTAAGLFSICGALALILATVGLFGTTYLTVGQRTREFGIRAALGATRTRVMKLVFAEALWLTIPGIVLGLSAAAITARAAASMIFRFDLSDPITYFGTALLQLLVALLACLLPALRATKADPMQALRAE